MDIGCWRRQSGGDGSFAGKSHAGTGSCQTVWSLGPYGRLGNGPTRKKNGRAPRISREKSGRPQGEDPPVPQPYQLRNLAEFPSEDPPVPGFGPAGMSSDRLWPLSKVVDRPLVRYRDFVIGARDSTAGRESGRQEKSANATDFKRKICPSPSGRSPGP